VTSHVRSHERGRHTTKPEHMPKSHQKHLEWTPSRIVSWAASLGPETAKLASAILEERRHPEQGYRSCLGILRLSKRCGAERLEAACARAASLRSDHDGPERAVTIARNASSRWAKPAPGPPGATIAPFQASVR
jgi:transposase